MQLEVRHVTRYQYSGPISETHMEVRLQPSEEMGQRLTAFELAVQPEPRTTDAAEQPDSQPPEHPGPGA